MAYPVRGRDPLLDSNTQAFLEKRGREVLGIMLILLGVFFALMLSSYSAADTGLLSLGSTVENWAGRFGAILAKPLMKILGHGTWALAILFLGWGLRLLTHYGADRLLSRAMYTPVVLLFASVYAATLLPSANWVHSFSMGGRFGDTVLYLMLQVMPTSAQMGTKIISLVVGVSLVGLIAHVLGITFTELKRALFAVSGLVVFVIGFAKARLQTEEDDVPMEGLKERVANIIRANPAMSTGKQAADPEPQVQTDETAPSGVDMQSLFRRVPKLLKRVAPEEAEEQIVEAPSAALNPADRIRGKISSAIQARVRPPQMAAPSHNPISDAVAKVTARVEPQMTRGAVPNPAAVPVMPTAPIAGPLKLDLPQTQIVSTVADEEFTVLEDIEENIFSEDTVTQAVPQTAPAVPELPQTVPVAPPTLQRVTTDQAQSVVQHRPAVKPVQSRQAQAEAQPKFQFEPKTAPAFEQPPLGLLMNPDTVQRHVLSDEALEQNARMLENVLDDYGIKGEIVSVRPGPVVTMYELEPAPGLKASRVIGLADDIARSMSALSARVSTVPGRSVIGIELPNDNREMVVLREILSTRDFGDSSMKLPLALGKDIGGAPIVANLAKMPHLLIAGTTGSGKSVAINTMILSLLYRLSPEDCRLIMIDPKMLELSVYDGIPHLLSPVVTDPKKAVVALKWVVGEMEERYRKMSKMGVRNIDGYNSRVADALSKGEMFSRTVQTGFDDETGEPIFETEEFAPEKLPYIVVIVDEMADLMMVAGKEIEACIQRLAQMARASGIHLIMATQRPSVDVITGTIKANFPTRISFQVTSKVDSRTILGEMGAEQLLGQGDMLYMAGGGKVTRVHGPFCSDEEVEEIVTFLKSFGPPEYVGGVVEGPDEAVGSNIDAVLGLGGNTDSEDALYDTAVQIVAKDRKCSTSYIQRKLAIGYNKAARLVEQMEDNGLVSPANHVGKREILMPEHNG
ncbi:MAG: DNA translocase FtsK 4TM domain-containing protein [Planktomarina sp.]